MPFSCHILPGSLSKIFPIPSIAFIELFTFLIVLVAFSELIKPVCPEWHNNWHGICPVQNITFQWFDKLLLMQSKILFFWYNHIAHLCSFLINYYSKIFFSFQSFLLFHLSPPFCTCKFIFYLPQLYIMLWLAVA